MAATSQLRMEASHAAAAQQDRESSGEARHILHTRSIRVQNSRGLHATDVARVNMSLCPSQWLSKRMCRHQAMRFNIAATRKGMVVFDVPLATRRCQDDLIVALKHKGSKMDDTSTRAISLGGSPDS